jgi:hypothetical protein
MGYNPHDLPVDFVLLRGVSTPGIASIEKAAREIKVDEVAGYGASGAVTVVHGRKLAHFDIVVTLTTPADWNEWDSFKEVVLTMPTGPNAKALDVWHPWLVMLDVRACVVSAVSQPEDDGTGAFRIRVSCVEFRRPKQQLAVPASAEQKPAAQDPVEIYIGKLTDQLQLEALGR